MHLDKKVSEAADALAAARRAGRNKKVLERLQKQLDEAQTKLDAACRSCTKSYFGNDAAFDHMLRGLNDKLGGAPARRGGRRCPATRPLGLRTNAWDGYATCTLT